MHCAVPFTCAVIVVAEFKFCKQRSACVCILCVVKSVPTLPLKGIKIRRGIFAILLRLDLIDNLVFHVSVTVGGVNDIDHCGWNIVVGRVIVITNSLICRDRIDRGNNGAGKIHSHLQRGSKGACNLRAVKRACNYCLVSFLRALSHKLTRCHCLIGHLGRLAAYHIKQYITHFIKRRIGVQSILVNVVYYVINNVVYRTAWTEGFKEGDHIDTFSHQGIYRFTDQISVHLRRDHSGLDRVLRGHSSTRLCDRPDRKSYVYRSRRDL